MGAPKTMAAWGELSKPKTYGEAARTLAANIPEVTEMVVWAPPVEEDVREFFEALAHNTTLRLLSLPNYHPTPIHPRQYYPLDSGIQALGQALRTNSTLEGLFLQRQKLDSPRLQILIHSLTQNPRSNLRELDLSSNHLDDEALEILAQYIRDQSGLTHLDLSYNYRITPQGVQSLAGVIPGSGLVSLRLDHVRVGDPGALALAEAVAQDPILETLSLGACRIGETGVRELAGSLAANTRLKYLNLEDNYFLTPGFEALVQVLQNQNSTLREVNINTLEDYGPIFKYKRKIERIMERNLHNATLRHSLFFDALFSRVASQ